jgi:hypothetical protein
MGWHLTGNDAVEKAFAHARTLMRRPPGPAGWRSPRRLMVSRPPG